ncbi:hypothetical protein [Paenibacillus agaridevorans]|nr:hypothetical protein [Paenibacillus agaridevorans]
MLQVRNARPIDVSCISVRSVSIIAYVLHGIPALLELFLIGIR